MRYSLRNQSKISAAYSPEVLKRIIDSLDEFFKNNESISSCDAMLIGDDEFKTLLIDDAGHSTNMIAFYIIDTKYDVYNLAFKEFIG